MANKITLKYFKVDNMGNLQLKLPGPFRQIQKNRKGPKSCNWANLMTIKP